MPMPSPRMNLVASKTATLGMAYDNIQHINEGIAVITMTVFRPILSAIQPAIKQLQRAPSGTIETIQLISVNDAPPTGDPY